MKISKEKREKTVEIIQRMNKEGMTERDIKENLRSIGLEPFEIRKIIQEAKTEPTSQELHESITSIHRKIESGEHIKPAMKAIEEHRKKSEDLGFKLQELHGDVTEHKEKLEDLEKSLDKLHEKHDLVQKKTPDASRLNRDISDLKKTMREIKPLLNDLKNLDEKILKTNRDILFWLKKK